MNLLIVDDEEKIREVIKEYSEAENYIVEEADNGKSALDKLIQNHYDLLILDIMMPEMDGYTLLKTLPKEKRIPTIILSARDEVYDKLQGFDLGIDDYVTKPFSPKELMARIKALAKRTKHSNIYQLNTLEINFAAHTVKINQQKINLTPKEFDILSYLIENKNIAISREQLLSKIWGYSYFGDDRTIDTHIKMLRSHLKQYKNHIETVRGIGYKFTDEENQ